MLLATENLAALNGSKRLINIRLGPSKIVVAFGHSFDNKLTRGFLNRTELSIRIHYGITAKNSGNALKSSALNVWMI